MASKYKTVLGDTWDLIAYQQMGNEKYMKQLIEANWPLSDVLRFDNGTELIIPDVPVNAEDNRPFWHADDETVWAEELT